MIAFDKEHKRLAMFKQEATPDFWNAQWKKENLKKTVGSGKTYHFIKSIMKRYVQNGSRVLEGGCGTGQVVFAMQTWGYDTYGVDFAEDTIHTVQELFPNLQLSVQDVRNLDFTNEFFDAYWSLGVIEHFWNGYEKITEEAFRVLKPGGYLFLTFPYMSPLRKLKAYLGRYPLLDSTFDPALFYEFMLDKSVIINELNQQGFTCVQTLPYDALKGLKDEVNFGQSFFQRLYKSRSKPAQAIRFLFTLFLGRLTGHMILLVCKKTS